MFHPGDNRKPSRQAQGSPPCMPTPELGTSPRAIWSLTWPQLLMMYIAFFMGLASVWVGGQISAHVQAALGMVTQCSLFLMVVVMALSSGATAAISQSLGAFRVLRAERYISATLLGSLGLGIIVALLGWNFGDAILRVIMVPEAIRPLASELWRVFMLMLPAQYVYAASGVIFRATRLVLPPLWVAALVCAANLFGCLGFGLGWFGLPDCGYMGIAWSNLGAQCLGAICNTLLLARSGYLRRRAIPSLRWLRLGLPYLIRVALPAAAAQIVWQSGYLTLFVLVASLPKDSVPALAGLTAGLRTEALLFLPGMAFNMTVAVLVGNSLGEGRPDQAKRISVRLVGLAAAAMSAVALALWPFRTEIACLLSQEAATQAQIISYLSYNLASTPFSIASTVMGGIMVGAGATQYNLLVYGGTFWVVRLPLGWLLGHRLWGTASGVFAAMLVSQCLQTIIMLYVVFRCDWARFAMNRQRRRS